MAKKLKAQTDFAQGLIDAVEVAESNGEIGWRQADRFRRAARNPRQLRRMEAAAITHLEETSPQSLKFGGEGGTTIDWSAAFAKFMEWAPRLLQLIALFK